MGGLSIDGLVWSIVGLFVNGSSLVSLILDERKVTLSEGEAALWRMFYRTGGLSKRLFKSLVAKHLEIVEFEPSAVLPTEDYFHILYTGRVFLVVFDGGVEPRVQRIMCSGEMFHLKYLGLFSESSVFESHKIRVTTLTKVKLFRFSRENMKQIATSRCSKGVWQSLLINNLSFVVETHIETEQQRQARSSCDVSYCDRIFRPLEAWEEPKSVLAGSDTALKNFAAHLVYYICHSFSPPWNHLTSIRQQQLPAPPARPPPVTTTTTQPSTAEKASSLLRPPRFHLLYSASSDINDNNDRINDRGRGGSSSRSSRLRHFPLWSSFSAGISEADEELDLNNGRPDDDEEEAAAEDDVPRRQAENDSTTTDVMEQGRKQHPG